MAVKLAVIGVDLIQRDWIEAVRALAAKGVLEIAGAGHQNMALAKDLAEALGSAVPAFDDLRGLMRETSPRAILVDRPENMGLDFLVGCVEQKIGIFSLGPPVMNMAEARGLAEVLEPRTGQLYIWPRMMETRAFKHCAEADEFVKPMRFIAAEWFGFNHALAKSANRSGDAVRSLSVLMWDALGTLIELVGPAESLYANFRGNVGKGDHFGDLSGAVAVTLRFAEQCVVSLTVSDRVGPWERKLLAMGQSGTLRLDEKHYHFSDADGLLIDEGHPAAATGVERALEDLETFFEQFLAPASPHRGWEHKLEGVASTLEAMLVSHRTGQAESPEKFLTLRR